MRDPKFNYERYILKLATRYGQDDFVKDLQQEGRIALWKAEEVYNPTKGTFHAIARQYIRGAMMTWLTNNSRTIRIPSNRLLSEDFKEIKPISTSQPLGHDENTSTVEDLLTADEIKYWNGEEIESYDYNDKLGPLRHYLSELDQDYQMLIKLRLTDELSFEEISEIMGTTKQNCSHRYQVAIKKLQKAFGLQPTGVKCGQNQNTKRGPSKLLGRPSPNKGKKYNKTKNP